jgi:hypothetical protein
VNTDEKGYKSVSYGGFTVYLIQAIKELTHALENFARRVTTDELCLGSTCITESELKEILDERSGGGSAAPLVPPDPGPEPLEDGSGPQPVGEVPTDEPADPALAEVENEPDEGAVMENANANGGPALSENPSGNDSGDSAHEDPAPSDASPAEAEGA